MDETNEPESSVEDPEYKIKKMKRKLVGWKQSLVLMNKSLEFYIEGPGIIILFLLISYVDILLGSWSLSAGQSSGAIEAAHEAILYIQCFELLLQMAIFHARFFSHWGYAIDLSLVGSRLLDRGDFLSVDHHHLHLLSYLRIWRFARVVQKLVAIEASKHDLTRKELASQIESTTKWMRVCEAVQADVQRERHVAKQNEDMVKLAREEIDTLREALKIAAMDVAASMEGYSSTDTEAVLALSSVKRDTLI